MKRKISLFMILLLLLTFVQPFTVYAEETVEETVVYPTGPLEDVSQYEKVEPDASRCGEVEAFEEYNEIQLLLELSQKIKNALLAGEQGVDVQGMAIDVNRYQISELIVFSPYLSNGINADFYYSYDSGAWTYIKLTNPMNHEETKAHILAVEEEISVILNQVSEGMSEEEKALAVHDYFVCQYEYDEDNYNAGTIPSDSFRSGGLFMNGIGVCQAYAEAYKYILGLLGMECHVTGSNGMNHAWNIVKVDGAYYHVDCTWDDPISDKLGRAYHEHFLLSDAMIKQRKHFGWDLTNLVCSSTKYDNAYWMNITSPIVMNGENRFYVEGTSLYRQNRNGQNKTALKDLGKWYVWGSNAYYTDAFSGLFLHENELYYNTASEIRKISLDGKGDALVYRPDEQLKNGYIYGIKKRAGKIEYQILKDPAKSESNVYVAPVALKEEVSGIFLSQTVLQMKEGESFYLEYHLAPQGIKAQVTWNTSNSNVAGVENGTVTAYGAGEATITATTDNGKRASCQVIVTKNETNVSLPFVDVNDGDWYQDAVKFVYARNIMTGMNEAEFGPGVRLSRAQFATILYRMQGTPEVWYDWEAFSDVSEGQFYTEAVMWARDTGVITGYEDGRFGPADEITREQMALMMFRYANYLQLDTAARGNLYEFPDADRVSGFAWEAVEWAVGGGLITGDQGNINPRGSAERGQCAIIIMRFMEGYGL